ncbi:uncharacterized protein LOC131219258 isoform X2 [Magnolia sinica]|uniref:uncharacterized protein LOC131219258 isoform X2 n=1 Tax=Magnolia sinica TaxID=86752 RepID=UPI00265A12F4|nr:uncharacterized protein LOC131219258 isoform X2 [Magnolia sinica]
MGDKLLNLNEPPIEDGFACRVLLRKDGKPICRTQCLNPPLKIPGSWNISEIKPAKRYSLSGLPVFSLRPTFENSQQKTEWGVFFTFLRDTGRVAAVNCTAYDFYILPPHQGSDHSHVQVQYRAKTPSCEVNEESIAPSESMQKPTTGGHAHPSVMPSSSCLKAIQPGSLGVVGTPAASSVFCEETTHCFGEEIGDSAEANVKGRNSADANVKGRNCSQIDSGAHPGWNSPEAKLPNTVRDPSPHESGGDGCRSLLQKQDDCLQKNFVRTDPSYLRTLGQAHSGWIFGAIAELVDNSRDAKASRLDISIEELYSKKDGKAIPVLSVIDDGHGMSHLDILRMLSFGHKQPEVDDPDHIGRFGIGFKTGAMRLGQDAIVLTQTSHSRSVALLSQTFNEDKDNIEIPIVSYCRRKNFMEVDTTINSEASANAHLKAIKEFSPFNEYFIGEKLGLFGEHTGTQIYIWNLDRWGLKYSMKWTDQSSPNQKQGDIVIRSERIRSRPGQISKQVGPIVVTHAMSCLLKVPLDYSLQAYFEVIFLDPRMMIFVQGSLVKSRPLAKSLNRTAIVNGKIMGKAVRLILGYSQIEWERVNCGIFLYWHGRLIEAYKRVGGMVHNADMGRGIIGVIDVTDIMNDRNGRVWVHSNKQGFQDCEQYAELEKWLGDRSDEYWDAHFDTLHLKKSNAHYKPDHEWVQCDQCRKWRKLSCDFNTESLPAKWFCCMPPFNGKCADPEEQVGRGVVTITAKRSGCHSKKEQLKPEHMVDYMVDADSGEGSTQTEDDGEVIRLPVLKRLRRGAKSCKKS